MAEVFLKSWKRRIGRGQDRSEASKALRMLVEQGKVSREGSGKKRDPFKYNANRWARTKTSICGHAPTTCKWDFWLRCWTRRDEKGRGVSRSYVFQIFCFGGAVAGFLVLILEAADQGM